MSIKFEPQSYLILTPTVPYISYKIKEGHVIKAVKTVKWMFDGFSLGIPHGYLAIMALPYVDKSSYDVWRNLVIFHSFVCNDPETYDYSERMMAKLHENPCLNFVANSDYYFERTRINSGERSTVQRIKRVNAIDFDKFPLTVYPTPKETAERPLTPEEIIIMKSAGMLVQDLEPEFEVYIEYRKAFELFTELYSKDKKLFNQIRLYVFAKSIREFHEVYRNENCTIAFYISILEALAGKPASCSSRITCDICHRKLPPHHKKSIEQHLIRKYGNWFKRLRKIRHKFFHESDYFDITDALYELEDNRNNREEKLLFDFQDEIEKLEKIARKSLIEAFVEQYNNY